MHSKTFFSGACKKEEGRNRKQRQRLQEIGIELDTVDGLGQSGVNHEI